MSCTQIRGFVSKVKRNCLETLGLKQKNYKTVNIVRLLLKYILKKFGWLKSRALPSTSNKDLQWIFLASRNMSVSCFALLSVSATLTNRTASHCWEKRRSHPLQLLMIIPISRLTPGPPASRAIVWIAGQFVKQGEWAEDASNKYPVYTCYRIYIFVILCYFRGGFNGHRLAYMV